MDLGRRKYQDLDVSLSRTPGQSRFNFMIEMITKDADGIMLVVDSSFPDSWPYAIMRLKEVVKIGKTPCVVAENKGIKEEIERIM